MACAPGSSCCDDCASAVADAQLARDELKRSTKALIDEAERAAAESGQCGVLGELGDTVAFFTGDDLGVSSDELCQRQADTVANLRLAQSQLFEQLDGGASYGRVIATLDYIETTARGLVEEAKLSTWAELSRSYARRIGEGAGEVVRGALEAASEGVIGAARGIGLGWLLIGAAVLAVWFNPNLLRPRS